MEDDRAFSDLLSAHLSRERLEVVCASSGVAAWNRLHGDARPFDLVVSDLRMPRLGGLDLLALLRAEGSTPFVLMTAFAEPRIEEAGRQLGAIAVLSKPFELDALSAIVFAVLGRARTSS